MERLHFTDAIDAQKNGKYSGSVGGQEAKKAQPGTRSLGEAAERFARPIILSESPDSIGLTTPASTVLFAEDSVTVTSSNDEIHILAKDSIVLKAGQSLVTLKDSDITFACPGTLSVKGAGNAFEGPGRGVAAIESLPIGTVRDVPHWIEVERKYYDGAAAQGAPVRVTFADGSIRTAKLDEAGFAHIDGTPAGAAEIEIGEDARAWKPDDAPPPVPNPAFGRRLTQTQAAELYELYKKEIG